MVGHRSNNGSLRESNTENNESATSADTQKSLLNRRSYLKLAGAATATVAGSAVGSGAAAAASYETKKIPADTVETFWVRDGETFENVLFDCTEPGAVARILTEGSGWTVRNVGWKGQFPDDIPKLCVPRVDDPSGHGLIEHVYFGDGLARGGDATTMAGAVWVSSEHKGTVTFRNICVHDMSTGIYASGPGAQYGADGGDTQIEASFAKNCNIAGFRTSGSGSYVKDSVIAQTGDVNGNNSGVKNARGVWLKDAGDMLIDNCDIDVDGPYGSHAAVASNGASGHIQNSRVTGGPISAGDGSTLTQENISDNPDLTPPSGVPMSATEAASGSSQSSSSSSGSDSGTSDTRTLVFEGTGEEVVTSYSFSVSGDLTRSGDLGSLDSADSVSGSSAEGSLWGPGVDGYEFTGEITEFAYDGVATVYVDGTEVDPSSLGALDRTLVFEGTGEEVVTSYSFSVSGDLMRSGDLGSLDSADSVSGSSAEGSLWGPGVDGYRFSGEITEFAYDGVATVYVDGTEVDPSSL